MLKKILILISGVTCGLMGVALIGAWWLGGFSTVELAREELGPYRIVCLEHTGPYHEIASKILKVRELGGDSEDRLGVACGIYYDDPQKVAKSQLRSKGGYVFEGELTVVKPLVIVDVPKRAVLVARVEAHPSVAALKVYPKMAEWLRANGVEAAGPALEFYHEGRVESQIPIKPIGE